MGADIEDSERPADDANPALIVRRHSAAARAIWGLEADVVGAEAGRDFHRPRLVVEKMIAVMLEQSSTKLQTVLNEPMKDRIICSWIIVTLLSAAVPMLRRWDLNIRDADS